MQKTREASNRLACENSLKQIGLALHQFHDVWKVFPSNGGWDGQQTILSVQGTPFTPETYDKYPTKQSYFLAQAYRGCRRSANRQLGLCHSSLPRTERRCISNATGQQRVPNYICPSRRANVATTVIAEDANGWYISGGWAWPRIDYGVNLFAFSNRPTCRSITRFTDGLSQTILVGEKAYDVTVQAASWYFDESFYLGGSNGTVRRRDRTEPGCSRHQLSG